MNMDTQYIQIQIIQKPPEGNFVSWVGVILVFTEISWGILKIVRII